MNDKDVECYVSAAGALTNVDEFSVSCGKHVPDT